MVNKTVAIYVFFDDILKTMDHKEPDSLKTVDAEIITVVLLAAGYFAGNIKNPYALSALQDLYPICSVKAVSIDGCIKSWNSLANFSFTRDKP
jgi:hypothetical protein